MAHLANAVGRLGFIALLILAPAQSWAQKREPITAQVAVPALASLKRHYEIADFRLGGKYDLDRREAWSNGGEGGTTLESLGAGPLRLAYIAVGTPKRNAAGEITNAIVISSYYSGDAANMYAFWYDGQSGKRHAFAVTARERRLIVRFEPAPRFERRLGIVQLLLRHALLTQISNYCVKRHPNSCEW